MGISSCPKASFACPMLSMGASVDPLVLSPVFITKEGFRARRSTTAVPWTQYPGFPPSCACVGPNSCGYWLVFRWDVGRLPCSSVTYSEHNHMVCVSTVFHLGSHVGGCLGKLTSGKTSQGLAHSIWDITQWKHWLSYLTVFHPVFYAGSLHDLWIPI